MNTGVVSNNKSSVNFVRPWGLFRNTLIRTIYYRPYQADMYMRFGLGIEAESNKNAIEIIKNLDDKGILTDSNIQTDNDGQRFLDVITYDEKIEFACEYATEPNVPSDLSGEKKLIISYTITLDPSGGTDDLDIVRYSINNLCDLRDDIKDNTDYVIKDIIQDVVK